MTDPRRALPSIGTLITSPAGRELAALHGSGAVKLHLRRLVDEARQEVAGGAAAPDDGTVLARAARRLAQRCAPAGRRAINASGILLHTGLGRAPLSPAAVAALVAAAGYTPLQASLDTGNRSLREEKVEELLQELTGCEAATVVNNNAAATMLMLAAVAAGREVVVSRGQLVEIGGAFRLPEVMELSGCRLREVGTTNKTHLRDYERAIGPDTGALLHVHTSNYRIRGFAEAPDIGALAGLGKARGVTVLDDLGSGALLPLAKHGLDNEPLVQDSLRAGARLCCFSADKLIGGPQAGIICGSAALVAQVRKHPIARMVRVCKLTLAALEATLLHLVNGEAETAIPFWRTLARPVAEVRAEAEALAAALAGIPAQVQVADAEAYIGSGSLPDEAIASAAVAIAPAGLSAAALGERLRQGVPPVFARLADRQLVIDCRTLQPGEAAQVAAALRAALA
ncbi:MAG: L-seryl-tRNA(Sec) selenium transferase [Planctomycetes bacterium]|nr:L-seryl-tRNA(Sec) selenium transferase [Planctomycetota bacterium]